jgi:hypothetical protein
MTPVPRCGGPGALAGAAEAGIGWRDRYPGTRSRMPSGYGP